MSKATKVSVNSDVYAQIRHLPMGEYQRARALAALRKAETIAAAIDWVGSGIRRAFGGHASKIAA